MVHFTGPQTGTVNINGCPSQAVTVTAQAGATSSPVTWTEPTATDNFGQQVTNIVQTHQPGQLFAVGQTSQVSYRFTANSGAQAVCTFTVTVNGKKTVVVFKTKSIC